MLLLLWLLCLGAGAPKKAPKLDPKQRTDKWLKTDQGEACTATLNLELLTQFPTLQLPTLPTCMLTCEQRQDTDSPVRKNDEWLQCGATWSEPAIAFPPSCKQLTTSLALRWQPGRNAVKMGDSPAAAAATGGSGGVACGRKHAGASAQAVAAGTHRLRARPG
jgi:hypothetical protein